MLSLSCIKDIAPQISGPDARARVSGSEAMEEMLSLMCEQLSSTSQKKGLLQPYTKCFRNLLLRDKYYSILIGVRRLGRMYKYYKSTS